MKISWLNEACTEAVITRGFWRARSAVVRRAPENDSEPGYQAWRFVNTGRQVGATDWNMAREIEWRRECELRKRADRADWLDTGKFPQARLVERKS